MEWDSLTRRRFLQGAAGAFFGLPLLPSLIGEKKAYAESAATTRHVFVFTSNGMRDPLWYPTQVPDSAFTQFSQNVRYVPLANIPGNLSQVLDSEFDSFRKDMLLIRGLDIIPYPIQGHQTSITLAGRQLADLRPCVAQTLASKIYADEPLLRSTLCMVKGAQDRAPEAGYTLFYSPSSSGKGIPVPTRNDPRTFFDSIFGSGKTGGLGSTVNKSVLDQVLSQLNQMLGSSRLSSNDKANLSDHADLVRSLERRLGNQQLQTCTSGPRPDVPLFTEAEVPNHTKNMIDISVTALKCGLTRVAGIMITPEVDRSFYSYISKPLGMNAHNWSHNDESANPYLLPTYQWQASQVAYLLNQLKGLPGNTIVYWGNSMGMGWWHETTDMPVAVWELVGDGGKRYFKTGYYVDYRQIGVSRKYLYNGNIIDMPSDRPYLGRCYNQFLEALLRSGGLSPKDYEGPGFGDYSGNLQNQYAENKGVPMPFIES